MYSNDINQIRAGFVNFIGASLKSLDGKANDNVIKQEVVAILCEEMLKVCSDKNNVIDLYAAKPLLRGVVHILTQRILEIEKLLNNVDKGQHNILSKIEQYKKLVTDIEDIIKFV